MYCEHLIGRKYYVKHLNNKILKYFSGSSSTANEPNFKIKCNCIHELLNVFEDSAQREHTIEAASQRSQSSERMGVACYYDHKTIREMSVLGHYLPPSLASLKELDQIKL